MDPTIIAAIAGVLGVILGAVIGGVFALKATKRQVEVMLLQSRGDVNERLYSQSLVIMKFFAENPELRPYFYDNKDLSQAQSELEKLKVLSTAEMVSGFMELVALQIEQQPAEAPLGAHGQGHAAEMSARRAVKGNPSRSYGQRPARPGQAAVPVI